MSDKLDSLVGFYVKESPKGKGLDAGAQFKMEKELEREVAEEVIRERIDEIDAEAERREEERAAKRELSEFRSVLLQCVTLALLVGILGSHLYGLLEVMLYQPDPEANTLLMAVALAVLAIVTVVVLFKEYIQRLFDATKKLRETRRKPDDER